MKKLTIAVDPGANGALVTMQDGAPTVYPFKGYADAAETIAHLQTLATLEGLHAVAYLEDVGSWSGVNGAAISKLNRNAGWFEGHLQGKFPLVLVRPQDWQKGIRGVAGTKGAERKKALKEEAQRQFPALRSTLKNCDALLLAAYGERTGGHKPMGICA